MVARAKSLSTNQQVGLLLGLIMVLGLILRIPSLNDSLLLDEISSYYVINGRTFGGMMDLVKAEQETTPPLYFIVSWFTLKLGDPSIALRLPSMVAGLATIPLTYLLGAWTVGRKAGMLGALLIAISPFMVFYSAEARPYAMLTCLLLLSTLCLIRAVRGGSIRWWVGFALFCAASMYTHYTAILILAGQFLWAFAYFKESRIKLLISVAGAAVLFVPWLPEYFADSDSLGADIIEILQPFGWEAIRFDVLHWGALNIFVPGDELPGRIIDLALPLGLLIAAVGLGREIWLRHREKLSWKPNRWVVLVIVLALSSPVIAAIISYVDVSIYLPRNLAGSWPGLALAIAALVLSSRMRSIRIAAATLVVFFYGFISVGMFEDQYQRTDYKGVAELIGDEYQPGDRIVEFATLQPSPLTPLDVELDLMRLDDPDVPQVERIGVPPRALQDAVTLPGGVGRFTKLPAQDPSELAKRIGDLSGDEKLFLVTPGGATERIIKFFPDSPVSEFVNALPEDVEMVANDPFPGIPLEASVLTFEKQPD